MPICRSGLLISRTGQENEGTSKRLHIQERRSDYFLSLKGITPEIALDLSLFGPHWIGRKIDNLIYKLEIDCIP